MSQYGYIYKITNLINGKVYIGQTTIGFDKRYKGSIKNTHNEHLKRAIEKYGEENFKIEKEYDFANNQEELNRLEIKYIHEFNSTDPNYGYNKTTGGESYTFTQEIKDKISKTKQGTIVSDETKAKLSELRKGEGNSMYGKHHSEETINKIKKARTKQENPMLGKHHSDETKNKIAEKHSKKVKCHTGEEFNSALEASKWCGLKCQTTICKSCNDKTKTKTAGKHPITGEKLYWQYL